VARARRAQLKLLAAPTRPMRLPYVPLRRLPRRPGERREPLALDVSPTLVVAAAGSRLELGCAVELCLERALVIRDLAALGQLHVYERLLALATTTPVSRALPAAKARYLQMLLATRDRQAVPLDAAGGGGDAMVDVPLRLFPRVIDVVDEVASAGPEQLAEALQFEVAAASDGRTMSEWAALAALSLSR
jgi:hypothetical protein